MCASVHIKHRSFPFCPYLGVDPRFRYLPLRYRIGSYWYCFNPIGEVVCSGDEKMVTMTRRERWRYETGFANWISPYRKPKVRPQLLKVPNAQTGKKKWWMKPPLLFLKLNSDGRCRYGICGGGGVVRDSMGALTMAYPIPLGVGTSN
uniref:RNase H type-1 domain-containing protein n=1 Tax=Solanum lycopersicum TaxID=4081 RepID=K4D7L5_SOLLC